MGKPDLGAAARWYAEQGCPVLPLHYPVPVRVSDYVCSCSVRKCASPAKHPLSQLVPHGLDDATTDPDIIAKWWGQYPRANIGLRTGTLFDALDIDGPAGFASYAELVKVLGDDVQALAIVKTGRVDGGRQYYVQPGGRRNFAGGRAGVPAGLDCRGQGGYVVAVPSQHISGARYEWVTPWGANGSHGAPWEAAYTWLTTRGDPDGGTNRSTSPNEPGDIATSPVATVDQSRTSDVSAYAQRALDNECAAIRTTAPGGRNHALNTSAYNIGQLVAAGQLDHDHANDALADAARAAGLDDREAARTIRSGMTSGATKPRAVPATGPNAAAAGNARTTITAHPVERVEDAWDAPEAEADPPPEFPLHVLGPIADACHELSHEMQTPPDLVGMLTLAAVAATVRGRAKVHVRRSWYEPLNLYVCVVAGVGETKSPPLSAITSELRAIEKEMQDAQRDTIGQKASMRRVQENRLRAAETAAAKAATAQDRQMAEADVEDARKALNDTIVPATPRLLASDMTAEALVKLLADQDGALASLTAEGGLLDTLAGGRYSSGMPNLDAILQAHDGREPILVDRKTGDPIRVDHPCLTLGLAVQPRVLERIGSNQDATGRGLCARFLYAVPQSLVGTRTMILNDDHGSSVDIVDIAYAIRRIHKMLDASRTAGSVDFADAPIRMILRLPTTTLNLFYEYRTELEFRRHPDSGDLTGLTGWSSKLDGQVIRLAGLLHLLTASHTPFSRNASTKSDQPPESWQIGQDSMINACVLSDYLIEHAKRAHLLMARKGPDGLAQARQLLDWATRNQDAAGEFSVRDAHASLRGRVSFNDAQAVHEAANELARRGHVRLLAPADTDNPRPGRPQSRYRLHPQHRHGNTG